jgi:hypothetical protein
MPRELVNSAADNCMGNVLPVPRGELDGGIELVIGDLEETVKWPIHAGQILAAGDVSHSFQTHTCVLHRKQSQP